AAAGAGRGGLVLISGEAGVGKTALAEALAREAADAGALLAVGHCYDRAETPPYGPWLEGFAQVGAADPADSSPALTPPRPAAAASTEAFFAQARAFFAARAAERPLLLTLEDLHWADAASFDLLRSLARDLSSLPLLLLVTYR